MTHSERALALFHSGANCAQAVFSAYSDKTGLAEDFALRLSAPFGGGIGRLREVCGAVSGMLMVAGLLMADSDISDNDKKMQNYAMTRELVEEFKSRHGSIICRELLGSLADSSSPKPTPRTDSFYKERPCDAFVSSAAEILEKALNK